MTNLTEQYRKGELPRNKVYYVKNDGEIFSCYLDWDNDFIYDGHIIHPEVLGGVPTYDEYISLLSDSIAKTEGEEINAELQEENAQLKKWCEEFNALDVAKENRKLKELLKECKHIMAIEKDFASCHFEKHKLDKLLAKIDQVLGEE